MYQSSFLQLKNSSLCGHATWLMCIHSFSWWTFLLFPYEVLLITYYLLKIYRGFMYIILSVPINILTRHFQECVRVRGVTQQGAPSLCTAQASYAQPLWLFKMSQHRAFSRNQSPALTWSHSLSLSPQEGGALLRSALADSASWWEATSSFLSHSRERTVQVE